MSIDPGKILALAIAKSIPDEATATQVAIAATQLLAWAICGGTPKKTDRLLALLKCCQQITEVIERDEHHDEAPHVHPIH